MNLPSPVPELALRGWARACVTAGGVLLSGLVFLTDREVRPDLLLTNAYLVPVAAVAWLAGSWGALIVALVATGLQSVAGTEGVIGGVVLPGALNLATAGMIGLLRQAYRRERHLARTDTVTGAPNRRAFEEAARRMIQLHARERRAFTAVGIDLDNFKCVNDRLGHDAGDDVLRTVAATLARNVRGSDVIARYGGDEFAVLLANTDMPCSALLERLHAALDEAMQARGWPVTFSIGAITFADLPPNERELMRLVDEQMYVAKRAGKSRLVHIALGRAAS